MSLHYPYRECPADGRSCIDANWFRLYDESAARGPWLITLDIVPSIVGVHGAFPQARAVIDDFGNLHCVRTWQ